MNLINTIFATAMMLALIGCANLEQAFKNIQQATADKLSSGIIEPPEIYLKQKDIVKICQEAKQNSVKTNEMYIGQRIAVSGNVSYTKEIMPGNYLIGLNFDVANIYAITTNKKTVLNIDAKSKTRVTGYINKIDNSLFSCYIVLGNSHIGW